MTICKYAISSGTIVPSFSSRLSPLETFARHRRAGWLPCVPRLDSERATPYLFLLN
jgi:hypothetical protein